LETAQSVLIAPFFILEHFRKISIGWGFWPVIDEHIEL